MKPTQIFSAPALHLIGLRASYTHQTRAGIPAQWQRWAYDAVPNVQGDLVYGVSLPGQVAGQFDYICALPVAAGTKAPPGQEALTIAPTTYAVFEHDGPVSGLAAIFDCVNCGGADLPQGAALAPGPQLEVYGEGFDPATATGRVQVWVPVNTA